MKRKEIKKNVEKIGMQELNRLHTETHQDPRLEGLPPIERRKLFHQILGSKIIEIETQNLKKIQAEKDQQTTIDHDNISKTHRILDFQDKLNDIIESLINRAVYLTKNLNIFTSSNII